MLMSLAKVDAASVLLMLHCRLSLMERLEAPPLLHLLHMLKAVLLLLIIVSVGAEDQELLMKHW